MVEYIYSEYAAVIKVRRASGIIRFIEMQVDAVINSTSLKRLIEGGVDIFIAINKNQNIDIVGLKIKTPFDKIILRVLNRS